MRIDIISAVPELLNGFFSASILKRAKEKKLVEIFIHDLRVYGKGKHKKIDDYLYSGEPGMLLSVEPVDLCLQGLKEKNKYDEIIFLAPDGEKFSQRMAHELAKKKNLIFLCGHYKGVDQRVRDHLITKEISIGDYVLSGGELPAAVICDALIRLIPGVLGNLDSALNDSFEQSQLAAPAYTRPYEYKGWKVPEVLLSGDHLRIKKWQEEKAIELTKKKRPDLL